MCNVSAFHSRQLSLHLRSSGRRLIISGQCLPLRRPCLIWRTFRSGGPPVCPRRFVLCFASRPTIPFSAARHNNLHPRCPPRQKMSPQLWLLIFLLTASNSSARRTVQDFRPDIKYLEDQRFPGWKGEVATVKELAKMEEKLKEELMSATHGVAAIRHEHLTYGGDDGKVTYSGEVYHLSDTPRVYLYKNFLTQEECDYLISHVRTSYGTHFDKGANEVIRAIEKRIAEITMIPEENGEPIQILRYEHGQKYEPHQDYFHDDYNQRPEMGGQRVATVLMYLATVPDGAGGETVFPHHKINNDTRDPTIWSECALKGLAVKATAGDAVLFWSIKPDGQLDHKSLHGSCPTYAGEKWSATKWIRAGPFGGAKKKKPLAGCHDAEFMCTTWAKNGECQKNPGYMLEACKKSCGICNPKPASNSTEKVADA